MLLTLEGGEGAGKSTLMKALTKKLTAEGCKVFETRAPGDCPLGKHLRDLILHTPKGVSVCAKAELFMYLADRGQHTEEVLRPALKKYDIVICDRFNDSTIVYQGIGRNLGLEEVQKLTQFATNGLTPDLTFYLDLDPKVGLTRLSSSVDRIEKESIEFHNTLREGFFTLAKQEPERFHIIDASKPKEDVLDEVYKTLCTFRK